MSCFLLDEMDPECDAFTPQQQYDADDDRLSQAASDFTTFSFTSATPHAYGTYSVMTGEQRDYYYNCSNYWWYDAPWQQPQMASYHPAPSAMHMMWSSYVEQLREVLSGFRYALEQVIDERSKRPGDMGLWRRSPDFSDKVNLPTDFFYNHILENACELAHGGCCEHDKGLASQGAVVVQQSFVLGNATQKIMITQKLKPMAKDILYHESGGFVVSQILTEALTDKGMVTDALQFMAKAHDADRCEDHKELLKSMQHAAANHSVRIWIELLGVQEKDENRGDDFAMHIDRWWRDIDGIVATCDKQGFETHIITLAQSCSGCRSLIQMFKSFGNTTRLKDATAQLVSTTDILLDLIKDEYGNYVIKTMVQENIEMPEILKCMSGHFLDIACHKHGNFVLQAYLGSPHCDAYRMFFEGKFEDVKQHIAKKDQALYDRISDKLRTSRTMAKVRTNAQRIHAKFQ